MIKVYKNGKLYKTFEYCVLSSMEDVEFIYWYLWCRNLIKEIEAPDLCEEPKQYTMRNSGFTLQSY